MFLSYRCHCPLKFVLSLLLLLSPNLLFHLEIFARNFPFLKDFFSFLTGFSFLFQSLLLHALLTFQVSKTSTSKSLPNNPCSIHEQLVFLLLFPPIWKRYTQCVCRLMTTLLAVYRWLNKVLLNIAEFRIIADLCINFIDCRILDFFWYRFDAFLRFA